MSWKDGGDGGGWVPVREWEREVERSAYVSVFAIVFESEIKEMKKTHTGCKIMHTQVPAPKTLKHKQTK